MAREVDDRFDGALNERGTEASEKRKRSSSEFAYLDEQSA